MNELIQKIEQWANDRNIIKGSKPIDQAMKLFSEFGELADNVGKGRDCRDDIGDCIVVLTIIAKQLGESIIEEFGFHYSCKDNKHAVKGLAKSIHEFVSWANIGKFNNTLADCLGYLDFIANNNGYTMQECVQIAYNDIKDRKGLMHNGVFIKESDPAYAPVVAAIESNCTIDEDALDNIEADKRMATQKRISVNLEDL